MLHLTAQPPPRSTATALPEIEALLAEADEQTLRHDGPACLARAAGAARDAGADTLTLEVEPALDVHDEITRAAGMRLARDMLQLRRSLPLGESSTLAVRPFSPGEDDQGWLEVNNRAFAWHPDQGGWTHDDLRARMAEPWFDPDGFLVHVRDGRIAGFCWTKVHSDLDPPLGEIFVIGVDPALAGRGLGGELLRAGLDHLANLGLTGVLLYVEADNEPALALYRSAGFVTHHHHSWWAMPLG